MEIQRAAGFASPDAYELLCDRTCSYGHDSMAKQSGGRAIPSAGWESKIPKWPKPSQIRSRCELSSNLSMLIDAPPIK